MSLNDITELCKRIGTEFCYSEVYNNILSDWLTNYIFSYLIQKHSNWNHLTQSKNKQKMIITVLTKTKADCKGSLVYKYPVPQRGRKDVKKAGHLAGSVSRVWVLDVEPILKQTNKKGECVELHIRWGEWRNISIKLEGILIHHNTHSNQDQHLLLLEFSWKGRGSSRGEYQEAIENDGGRALTKKMHAPNPKKTQKCTQDFRSKAAFTTETKFCSNQIIQKCNDE